MDRKDVHKLIDGERAYQDELHGNDLHSPEEWLVYIESYIDEAKRIVTRESRDPYAKERVMGNFRKIAGMAVAAMEQHDTPPRKPV